jgi:hypothetical protein
MEIRAPGIHVVQSWSEVNSRRDTNVGAAR